MKIQWSILVESWHLEVHREGNHKIAKWRDGWAYAEMICSFWLGSLHLCIGGIGQQAKAGICACKPAEIHYYVQLY